MVFTEFAALVQARWQELRALGDGPAARARKSRTTRSRRGRRARQRSKRSARADDGDDDDDGDSLAQALAEALGDPALAQATLLGESPAPGKDAPRYFDSGVSSGGYSTLDEDDEFRELLLRQPRDPTDPIDRACAAAVGALQRSASSSASTCSAGATPAEPDRKLKTLGSPEELVETEPEDDELLRDSDPFSGYSTFDEEEERDLDLDELEEHAAVIPKSDDRDSNAAQAELASELKPSAPEPVTEIIEIIETYEYIEVVESPVKPQVDLQTLEAGIVCGEDMFGQATASPSSKGAPSSPLSSCLLSSPCTSTVESMVDETAQYCPGLPDEYACEIYANLRAREPRYHVTSDYFTVQPSVKPKMRSVLVDWLVEVHQRFELEPQTLFLTINYIDRYLANVPVRSQRLQLVGVASLLIASKFEEIYPCDMDDLLYICERSYSREELIECEKSMLNSFHFELAGPTVSSFVDYLMHSLDEEPLIAHLAMYLAESSLVDFNFCAEHAPSKVAAASLMAAYCFVENQPPTLVWNFRRQELTGYTLDELVPCARTLWGVLRDQPSDLVAISNKYGAEDMSHVSRLPLDDLELLLE